MRLQQPVQLGAFRRRSLYGLVAMLVFTGALWLWAHLTRADDQMPGALEPWMMKLHGAAAMLMIYVAGTMLYGHMLNAWHVRRNRYTGGAAALVFMLLGASGYGLYYFNGETLRRATEWLHWGLGFGAPLLLCWHVTRGHRLRAEGGTPDAIHRSRRGSRT